MQQIMESDNLSMKMIIIGDCNVGKTSIISRYFQNQFDEFYVSPRSNYCYKNLRVYDNPVIVQIWDTAGEERFRSISPFYYRRAAGVLLVYSITDRSTFESIRMWMGYVRDYSNRREGCLLIGNKVDLESNREVSFEEGQSLAAELNLMFIETSAKTGININSAFDLMINYLYPKLSQAKYSLDINRTPTHLTKYCLG